MLAAIELSWYPSLAELGWFAPELALVGTIVVILVAPLILGRSGLRSARIAFAGALVTLLLSVRLVEQVGGGGISGLAPESAAGMLILDKLTILFKIILMLFLTGVTALWVLGSSEKEENGEEFFVLMIGSALGMALMTSTLNLLMMAVAIEAASLPSYAIAGFDKRNRKSAEASVKYVIFGGVSVAIMLYGISLLYGMYHTLNVAIIAQGVANDLAAGQNTVLISMSLFCVLGGIAFKIAAVPFHFWCPDVFEGAKIEVTAWLSVASKAAALVLLLRLVDAFNIGAMVAGHSILTYNGLAWGLGVLAAISCTWGNFAAYRQSNVKRLLAYSSIAHAGYMMMLATIFTLPGTTTSGKPMAALMIYLIVYAVMNLGVFTVAAIVSWQTKSEDIGAFSGLGRRAPWLAVPMVCCLVSLVGLPPFGGFIAKYWLLLALGSKMAETSLAPLSWILIIVVVINTLISLFFYFRIIRTMFLSDDQLPALSPPFLGTAMANLCAVLLLLFGVVLINEPKELADRYTGDMYKPTVVLTSKDVPINAPGDMQVARSVDESDAMQIPALGGAQ